MGDRIAELGQRAPVRVVGHAHSAAPLPGPHLAGYAPLAPDAARLIGVYRNMVRARVVDEVEQDLVARGEAYFQLSGAGHEATAALGPLLTAEDWLHLHYRDKGLLIARGVPLAEFFHNLLCTSRSQSAGRQMAPFMSDPTRRVLSQNIPVGNHALQAVGVGLEVRDAPGRPIVVCGMGDGATQQGEVLEAMGEAVRSAAPVLFVVHDNGFSISNRTRGKTFFSLPKGYEEPMSFLGLPIHRVDGREVARMLPRLESVIGTVRTLRRPSLLVVDLERLGNHTNADDERVYRSEDERAAARRLGDPLRNLGTYLLENGLVTESRLEEIAAEARTEVWEAAEQARRAPDPSPIFDAKAPLPSEPTPPDEPASEPGRQATLLEALRGVLEHRLRTDGRVRLLGQDIEDPKGDVFGVTRGLSTSFPGRVENAALSESTILGVTIGRALAGARPVAFIQFADFLPLAFNQIVSELGSMYWRTNGGWNCPVIVMVACGGYRAGLGPFHAQTFESMMAHVPGVDVVMPSSADDAAGLLNAAFESGRPTLFFYPKIVLNDPDRATTTNLERARVKLGTARHVRSGDDLTLVSWGSTVPLCENAADALTAAGAHADVIDLRSLFPWDQDAVIASARRTGKLIVVHEDSLTCGFGAEVVATVAERAGGGVTCRRVARPDTYVPCNYGNQLEILPSLRRVLTVAAELLELDLSWDHGASAQDGTLLVEAPRSSPADQTVTVTAWSVAEGDTVHAGQPIAELEADKAVFAFSAPAGGRIEALLVPAGETVRVGAPLLRITTASSLDGRRRAGHQALEGTPRLARRAPVAPAATVHQPAPSRSEHVVGLSGVAVALGSRTLRNDDLAENFRGRTGAEILQRTGIESRRRLGADESALSLAVTAAREALQAEQRTVQEIDGLICCTTTPEGVTPSMACRILAELGKGGAAREVPAFDINAACCGYLYALAIAFDWARSLPEARLLIVTTETMSRLTNPTDFDTHVLFGDAATATLVGGPGALGSPSFLLRRRPLLSARGEPGEVIRVPAAGTGGHFAMDGKRAYFVAMQQMPAMLMKACADAEIGTKDLRWVVPHQANGRLIEDVRARLGLSPDHVFGNVRHHGNTSSSSIPVCLAELGRTCTSGDRLGLTAFGGGFTFAAAILEARRARA